MSNYDYESFTGSSWNDRFPPWANGYSEWQNQVATSTWTPPALPPYAPPAPTPPRTSRVFISHRQADTALARRVAYLADDAGFDFWLDVMDPTLNALAAFLKTASLSAQQESMAFASVIQMGLINCTHVLVLMTPNSVGSEWIYYEYGFAKRAPGPGPIACAWVHPVLGVQNLPGYMLLAPHHVDEPAITRWFGGSASLARLPWKPRPTKLP